MSFDPHIDNDLPVTRRQDEQTESFWTASEAAELCESRNTKDVWDMAVNKIHFLSGEARDCH